jgi:hypothetical protein
VYWPNRVWPVGLLIAREIPRSRLGARVRPMQGHRLILWRANSQSLHSPPKIFLMTYCVCEASRLWVLRQFSPTLRQTSKGGGVARYPHP